MKEELKETSAAQTGVSRRQFLSYAGLASAGLVIASCNKDDDDPDPVPDGVVDLGSEDIGLLNYMFALKQLSAAFYTKLASKFYTNAPTAETEFIPDIRDHEIAHRELLRNMLGKKRIQDFAFFLDNKIDFTSRTATLNAAKDIEQKMISGFLGVAGRFVSPEYLGQVAKMASVNGRHLGYINDIQSTNNFGADLNAESMDVAMTPESVLNSLSKYYPTGISVSHLPKQ